MRAGVMAFLMRLWDSLPLVGASSHQEDIRASQSVRRRAERTIDRWNEAISQSWERQR